ncbi:DUF4238 domain-containing protein [Candidatus Woesearchaeota archaeon]|nr:DUF4238 domain-containing protein [Candidatus Woesearchaeota archaeon]MBW3005994.1 DUF4238 domain-containing protein [Candidatus Woesearchaeota archaeon]
MSHKIKKQHYVPQLYLKGFSTQRNKEKYLFVYNKENKKCFQANIRKIACENYFYDIDETQITEKIFSKIESEFNIPLQKLIQAEDLDKLNESDKKVLSYFIAAQLFRTKQFRLTYKQICDGLFDKIGKSQLADFKEGQVTLTEDSLKRLHISSIFSFIEDISKIIQTELSWKLCINNTKMPFWTSDNPIVFYNELESDPFVSNMGLKCKGFQLHFPLSHRLLLILLDPNTRIRDLSKSKTIKDPNYRAKISKINEKVNFRLVDLLPDKEYVIEGRVIYENNLQIFSSTQFIFSKDNDFKLADKYLSEYPKYRNKNRKWAHIT